MALIPWRVPRGALHDLARVDELSETPVNVLLLSDRSLYLLHNLADVDIGMRSRYIAESTGAGYTPPAEGTSESDLMDQAVQAFRLEVIPLAGLASLIFGESTPEALSSTPATAGTNYLYVPSSPTTYRGILTLAKGRNNTNARSGASIEIKVPTGGGGYVNYLLADTQAAPNKDIWYDGCVFFPVGTQLIFTFYGCALYDVLQVRYRYTPLLD
jgi:hypothetical protein